MKLITRSLNFLTNGLYRVKNHFIIFCLFYTATHPGESNGSLATDRLSHSLPGSPADRRPNFPEVVGSAESLVGRVSI